MKENESLSWDALRTLFSVQERGSISAAAVHLGVSQPTVTRRIAALEESCGQRLLVRAGRRAALTRVAAGLIEPLKRMYAEASHIERDLMGERNNAQREVRLATTEETSLLLLTPRLQQFRVAHPNIVLNILSGAGVQSLAHNDAEVSLRIGRPKDGDLFARKVGTLNYRRYIHRRFYYGGRLRKNVRKSLPIVRLSSTYSFLPEEKWVDAYTVGEPSSEVVVRASSVLSQAEALAAGLGMGLLPGVLAARYPVLRAMNPTELCFQRHLYLVVHRELRTVSRVRAVMSWVYEACAELRKNY